MAKGAAHIDGRAKLRHHHHDLFDPLTSRAVQEGRRKPGAVTNLDFNPGKSDSSQGERSSLDESTVVCSVRPDRSIAR
jgi:hypothetical protein